MKDTVMSERIPYTYFLFHVPTGLKYYGSKYGADANPSTFWQPGGYFTSSIKVKQLIQHYGIGSFRAQVCKIFETPAQALDYEYRFLKKVNAIKKLDWLNRNLGGHKFKNIGPASEKALVSQRNKKQSETGNRKRSIALSGRPKSESTKSKMSAAQRSRSFEKELHRRDKIRSHATGRRHSASTKSKLSVAVSNTRWINNGIISKKIQATQLQIYIQDGWIHGRLSNLLTCPICQKVGAKHNMTRHHFDKCRSRL